MDSDGRIVTVYDYKSPVNPRYAPETCMEWNIGGHDHKACALLAGRIEEAL
jgi:hypothetical protein